MWIFWFWIFIQLWNAFIIEYVILEAQCTNTILVLLWKLTISFRGCFIPIYFYIDLRDWNKLLKDFVIVYFILELQWTNNIKTYSLFILKFIICSRRCWISLFSYDLVSILEWFHIRLFYFKSTLDNCHIVFPSSNNYFLLEYNGFLYVFMHHSSFIMQECFSSTICYFGKEKIQFQITFNWIFDPKVHIVAINRID